MAAPLYPTCNDLREEGAGEEWKGAHRRSGAKARVRAEASAPAQPSPPHRVSNLESDTRLEPRDDLVVETGGVEG